MAELSTELDPESSDTVFQEFDLASEEGAPAAGDNPDLVLGRQIARSQEQTRRRLAYIIGGTIPAVLGASIITVAFDHDSSSGLAEVLQVALPSITGLVGAILGFYFATPMDHHP